jgi:hypothetical protein
MSIMHKYDLIAIRFYNWCCIKIITCIITIFIIIFTPFSDLTVSNIKKIWDSTEQNLKDTCIPKDKK